MKSLSKLPKFRVRHMIIFTNAFFLIASATIILTSMWISSERNAQELSESLINEIKNSVSNRTQNYFSPVEDINRTTTFLVFNYFTDPMTNAGSRDQLFRYYQEVLRIYNQSKMMYYSDISGNLIMLNRMSDGSYSRRFVSNDGSTINIRWEHSNPAYHGAYPNTAEPADTGYDPRKRIWYTTAVEQKAIIWTPVYLFATDNIPGFTCAVPIYNSSGGLAGVSSIDIAVDELSRFLGTIHPTPGTKIVIVDKAENLVAIQAAGKEDLEKLFETSTDERGNRVNNIRNINAYPDPADRYILNEAISLGGGLHTVRYKSERYKAVLSPITIGNGLDLSIGIIIPENDIVGNVRKNLFYVTLFSVAALVLILISSSLLSNAIANPMQKLSAEMSKIKDLDLDSDVSINTSISEIINMNESFEGMRLGLKNFKRYVPSDLVAKLINEEVDADIGGEKRELTIFFSDIAQFTSISEDMDPEGLVADLCVYFEKVSKTILSNRGTVDKYIGDSVMAFWGAPVLDENHAEQACRSAVLIQQDLRTTFHRWENQGKIPFYTRIGIHTGEVIVGNMGYNERLNYTVIGDSVNLASRLEGVNKLYGTKIIVSQDTWNQCSDKFEFRRLDRVSVVGRKEGIDIYELYSEKNDIEKPLRKLFNYYETGLAYYFDKKWDEALKYFSAVLKYRPVDGPSKIMRDRCLNFKKNPPAEGWTGIYAISSK
ncbi:hypothetical protein LJC14_01865 [Treponema sp. OttesenSCG-928-L16]|nr:hypothetical protein [Treponema sp. OttesenSCG-928-L16]